MKTLYNLLTSIFLFAIYSSEAQSPKIDSSFGTNGLYEGAFGGGNDFGRTVAIEPDGKIIAGGYSWYDNYYHAVLVKYYANGSIDSSFGNRGVVFINTPNFQLSCLVIQDDGKILAAGRGFIARFNSNGTTDSSFSQIGINNPNEFVRSIAIEPDKKIILGGYKSLGDSNVSEIIILDSAGNIYSQESVLGNVTYSLVLDINKIITAGVDHDIQTGGHFEVAQYLEDGEIDSSFGTNGTYISQFSGTTAKAFALAITPAKKIIAAGYTIISDESESVIVQYDSTGVPDSSFGKSGIVLTKTGQGSQIHGMAIQRDGKILTYGYSLNGSARQYVIARYLINGDIDSSFGVKGMKIIPFGNVDDVSESAVIQQDGKIFTFGYTYLGNDYDFALSRENTDGSPDNSFGIEGKRTTQIGSGIPYINYSFMQSDGKILAGGYSYPGRDDGGLVNPASEFLLVRLNSDGTRDSSFKMQLNSKIGAFTIDNHVYYYFGTNAPSAQCRQSTGKIVDVVTLDTASNFIGCGLVRLNPDGAIDTTFANGGVDTTGLIQELSSPPPQAFVTVGDKIIVCQEHSYYPYTFAIGYNPDGSLDTTFKADRKTFIIDSTLSHPSLDNPTCLLQQDGKLLFARIEMRSQYAIIRLNAHGARDSSFGKNGVASSDFLTPYSDPFVASIAIDSNGRIF